MGSISINDDKIIGGSKSITASTILAPPCDMNLSLDTANITLTLEGGAFIGQKLSVVANATSSLVYTGVNGTTTEGLASGKKAILTWTGSYWLCSVSVVIQGKNATGAAFQYSGGLSVEAMPDTGYKVVTINGSILDPSKAVDFLLNINVTGASCSLGTGASVFQKVEIVNISNKTLRVSYLGKGNTTYIDALPPDVRIAFIWNGTNWSRVGFMYAQSEMFTGSYWINSEPIYRKTFALISLSLNDAYWDITHGITDLSMILFFYGTVKTTNGNIFPITRPCPGGLAHQIDTYYQKALDKIRVGIGASSLVIEDVYLTIEYIKSV